MSLDYVPLKLVSALGSGLVGGVFFAFSTFVMNALAQRPQAEGIAAMQAINITVINPLFMLAFLGTAVACLILGILSLLQWHPPGTIYSLSGCLCYLIGTFLVTIACNVPLNDALATVDPDSAQGARVWANYLVNWTNWNHVRTVFALASTVLLTLAIGK